MMNRDFLSSMSGGSKSEEARNIFVMPAYNAVFLQKENTKIEEGDKIVIHSSVLDALTRNFGLSSSTGVGRKMPSPLIFEVMNKKFGKTSHVGVLEFAAPKRAAYLPKWMMDNLVLNDGDTIQLRLRELPKAAKVTFQPRLYKFTKLPDPVATLQWAIGKFTALTQGDTIVIQHANEEYALDVLSVEPNKLKPPAVCVVDTTVKVEFEAPLEKAPVEIKPTDININQKLEVTIKPNEWAYFRLRLVDPNMGLKVSLVDTKAGDPDLYISTQTDKPGPTNFMWKSDRKASGDSVIIDIAHPQFSKSWYWIGVHAYQKEANFSLIAEEELPASEKDKDKKSEPAGNVTGHAITHAPTDKQCTNCLAWMAPAKLSMHTLVCERNNWRCPICNKVLRKNQKDSHVHCPKCQQSMDKSELEKHLALTHAAIPCPDCGAKMEPDLIDVHRKEVCPKRLANCKFCNVTFPFSEVTEHENYCGSKGVPCEMCGKDVPRKRMSIHLATDHGVNGSIVAGSGPVGKPFTKPGGSGSGSGSAGGSPNPNHKTGGGSGSAAGRGSGYSTKPITPSPHRPGGAATGIGIGRGGGGSAAGMGGSDKDLDAVLAASRRDASESEEAALAVALAASISDSLPSPQSANGGAGGSASGSAAGTPNSTRSKPQVASSPPAAAASAASSSNEDSAADLDKCPYCQVPVANHEALIRHLDRCPSIGK